MADEQVEYHVSIHVTKVTSEGGLSELELLPEDKWAHMAATYQTKEDALECAKLLKGFLLGM